MTFDGAAEIDRSFIPEADSFEHFVASIDDHILKAQFIAPLWTESALLKHRPDPSEIAGYIHSMAAGALIPLISDDCLIISSRGAIQQLITITSVPAAEQTIYQLTINQFVIETNVLRTLQLVRELARAYDILSFRDAEIIDELQINGAGAAFADYIANPGRCRPAFVMRRASQFERQIRESMTETRSIIAMLGPVAVSDKLFKQMCDSHNLDTYRSDILAFAPNGTEPEILELNTFGDLPYGMIDFMTGFPLMPPPDPEATLRPPGHAATLIWGQTTEYNATRPYLKTLGDSHRKGWQRVVNLTRTEPDNQFCQPEPQENRPVQPVSAAPVKLQLDTEGYPKTARDLAAWCDERLPETIVLLPRAIRSLAKCDHPDPARLARALEALASYKPRIASGDRAATAELHEQLLTLRLRDGFSNAEYLRGQTGDAYMIRYQGRALLLDRHLASTVSGMNDRRMIRIYYTRDPATGSILVGSLPYHLPTKRS
jgi:hypothetical protein